MTDCWKYYRPPSRGEGPSDWDGGEVWFRLNEHDRWTELRRSQIPLWLMQLEYRYTNVEEPVKPHCDACKFYDRGECKRYPPTQLGTGSYSQHVRVQMYNWCGEFKPK